jgi:hypothetical protein
MFWQIAMESQMLSKGDSWLLMEQNLLVGWGVLQIFVGLLEH